MHKLRRITIFFINKPCLFHAFICSCWSLKLCKAYPHLKREMRELRRSRIARPNSPLGHPNIQDGDQILESLLRVYLAFARGNTPSMNLYFTNTLSYGKFLKNYPSDLTGGAKITLGAASTLEDSLRALDSPSRRFPTKCIFVRVRFWTRF